MKIALYLGSFNPFHRGHLSVIKQALDDFNMDLVVIVPSMQNPWKKEKVLDMEKRIGIIHSTFYFDKKFYTVAKDYYSIIYKNKIIRIDTIEKDLISPYYSYATLHALKTKYCNHEVFVLCGSDIIEQIPDWMNGGEIIKDYNFLICDRPTDSVSSSKIRESIKNSEDITEYVDKHVSKLIYKYYKPQL